MRPGLWHPSGQHHVQGTSLPESQPCHPREAGTWWAVSCMGSGLPGTCGVPGSSSSESPLGKQGAVPSSFLLHGVEGRRSQVPQAPVCCDTEDLGPAPSSDMAWPGALAKSLNHCVLPPPAKGDVPSQHLQSCLQSRPQAHHDFHTLGPAVGCAGCRALPAGILTGALMNPTGVAASCSVLPCPVAFWAHPQR